MFIRVTKEIINNWQIGEIVYSVSSFFSESKICLFTLKKNDKQRVSNFCLGAWTKTFISKCMEYTVYGAQINRRSLC